MKIYENLTTIPNVVKGGTVSINLPVGNVYEKVFLKYEGVTPAQLLDLEVRLNDRMVSEWPNGERMLSMEKHYNRKTEAGVLIFNFTRPEMHNLTQQRFFGLDTSPSQGVKVANIKLKIASDATAPKLSAWVEKSLAVAGSPNFLTKVRRFYVSSTAAGRFDIDNLGMPEGAAIAAIHLYHTGDAEVTKAELIANNTTWADLTKAQAETTQRIYGRVPQVAECTVIDMVLDGEMREGFPITSNVKDFRLRVETAGAGQVEVMVEYVDMWGQSSF